MLRDVGALSSDKTRRNLKRDLRGKCLKARAIATVEFEIGFSSEHSMIFESTHISKETSTIKASWRSTLH